MRVRKARAWRSTQYTRNTLDQLT